jgi:hypothetical protein
MRPHGLAFALALSLGAPPACTREALCPSDQILCRSACAAVSTDGANCGACGHACVAGEVCSAGLCTCPGGRVDCGGDGACVDLKSDPGHCGGCGVACPGPQVCSTAGGATACAASCGPGLAACGRACVDAATDPTHCGTCGRTCGVGEHCGRGLCLADLYLACFDTDEVRGATADLAPAGVPLATEAGPISLAWLGNSLFVADSTNNTVDELRFDPPGIRKANTIAIPSVGFFDLEYLAVRDGLLYVSNAAGRVDHHQRVHRGVIDEIQLGPGSLPAGIAFLGGKAYVALNGTSEVAVVEVSREAGCQPGAGPCGSVSKRIALPPALASPAGSPLPSRLAIAGDSLYVTLWNLKPDFTPAGDGRLAVIDTATDALATASALDLGPDCLDPGDIAVRGQTLYVTCGYFPFNKPGDITGAAIVPVDISGASPAVQPALTLTGYSPGPLVFCGSAGYTGDRASGFVLRYDAERNAVTRTSLLCPPKAAGSSSYVGL